MADMVAPSPTHWPPIQQYIENDRIDRFLRVVPELDPIFRRYMASDHCPGIAYGVVVDGELVYTQGLGVRDVASQAPDDADTVFRIASMTKSFVALAILQLRDQGKLRLDDPVVLYCPELAALKTPHMTPMRSRCAIS
ncbi:MAG: beta-lactamase family protein [Anaerolineales bacterium]|nr:beta-lactamase family protein [Anaerolineales bacterium]